MNYKKLIIAQFNAEEEFYSSGINRIPTIKTDSYLRTVLAMNELMIYTSTERDNVVLNYDLPDSFIIYLNSIGVFFHYTAQFQLCNDTYELLDSYADIYKAFEFAAQNKIPFDRPPFECIRKVNSKEFSVKIAQKLHLNSYSKIVFSYKELEDAIFNIMNSHGKVIVKDFFGSAGKGNLLIKTEKDAFRLLKHLDTQKKFDFIVEPFFPVKTDFSIQAEIYKNGKIDIISVQEILNRNGSYIGSKNLSQENYDILNEENYFCDIQNALKEIFYAGYYGNVCIDSFITTSNKIILLVDINCRKSMSLIKHHLDLKFSNGRNGYFFSKKLSFDSKLTFSHLIKRMEEKHLLFTKDNLSGFIPLTCNTLFINRSTTQNTSVGKMYFYTNYIDATDLAEKIEYFEQSITKITENYDKNFD